MGNGERAGQPEKGIASIKVSTGVAGLDEILGGGLLPNRFYLIEGDPGAGKTTLALQFLFEGVRRGERCLYITLSETAEELRASARSHGWSLDKIELCDLVGDESSLTPDAQYTVFHPSEVELSDRTNRLIEEIEKRNPVRVVIDSLSEMRMLAQNTLRYRRQILALKSRLSGKNCTFLLIDDVAAVQPVDLQLRSIVQGVIVLEQMAPEFGAERRRVRVIKMRGSIFRGGYHDFRITTGGLEVYPRLVATDHTSVVKHSMMKSGIPQLDALLGGGLDAGTSTLIMGAAGTGKSSMALQYALAAAASGGRAAIFSFDESTGTLLARSKSIGLDISAHIESGSIAIQQVDPAELSPGEFAALLRRRAESPDERPLKVVIIDSLNGYVNAMPEERFLIMQLHEMLTFLGRCGIVTILVVAQNGLIGPELSTPVDTSYLADTVVLLRFVEYRGEVRQAVSAIKKRSGQHERTIREFRITSEGLRVGPPMTNFRNVLSGTPLFESQMDTETGGHDG